MRRGARIAGALALGLIALCALLVGATLTLLQTRAGGELARRIALPRINAELAGSLALDELRFRGDRLALGGIVLRDPRGGVVARVARVEVAFRPLALLRRHLLVHAVEITRPELYLVQDARGSNLARALAPRHPAPPKPAPAEENQKTSRPGVDLDLKSLTVSDGVVDFRSLEPGAKRRGRLTALDLQARARYVAASAATEASVDLDFDGGSGHLAVSVDTPCAGCLRARLETLRLPGSLLRGLVPGLDLEGALVARGSASKSGQVVTADLRADAGGGWVEARGAVDLATLRAPAPGLTVRARDIDLSRFSRAAPPSAIALDLEVQGGGRALDALDGSLKLVIPPSRLDGHLLGPVRLNARAVRGRFEIADLHASLPGLEVSGHGSATAGEVDVRLRLVAADLAALSRSLTPPGGHPPLVLGGRGRLDLALVGPVAAPALRVAGQFPTLRAGQQRAQGLTLTAVVPNLRRPTAADLDLAAPVLAIGQRELRGIVVSARAASARITLSARTTGPFPLAIAASGRRDSAQALTLNTLALRYPEASWSLARPARIQVGDARLSVEGFRLQAEGQSIAVDLTRGAHATQGRVVIAGLDLGRLPRALLPPGLALGGTVDSEVRLSGTSAQPQLEARLALEGGRVRGYRDLALQLDVRYARARASGQLSARGLGARLDAQFDGPAAWPPPAGRAPVHLQVALGETDLGALMKALASASGRPAPARLRGRARLEVHLDGPARAPRLGIEVNARGLAVGDQVVGDLGLTVAADGDGPSEARLEIAHTGGAGAAATHVAIKTPLSLQRLLHRPPNAAELQRTPIEIDGAVASLPLAALAQLARYPMKVGGTLSSRLELSGTMQDPRGQASIDVSGATTGRFPPTDARFELDLEPRSVEARLRVVRRQNPLLALVARLGAPPAALRTPAALVEAPLRIRAVLGPLATERLGLPPATDRDPPRALTGRLHADLALDGSLRAPQLLMHLRAGDVRLDKALVGAGQITVSYADRAAKVDAQLTSQNGGTLRAQATAHADLGYPALTKIAPEKLPLEVKLDAQRFDLHGLSGIVPDVRTVGGLIAASAALRGTVGDPRVSGKIEWSDGVLAISGLGDFRQIHLAVHGDEQNLTLDDLSLAGGAGRAHLTGTAAHVAGKGYQLAAHADVKSFPIYQEGQPLAKANLSADVKATVSPLATRGEVDIHEARIELSDAKRKNLQPLSAPDDVVLVENGRPLNRAQAKKLQDLQAEQRRLSETAAAQPADKPVNQAAPAEKPAAARRGVRVTVNAPRQLWVTGKDAYLELGLSPGFRVSVNDETRMVGQVIVHRGRINAFGRRFDIKADSTLQFDGPPDKPELDVSAQYVNQTENVTVLWTAKGPIDHLTISVSSPNRPDLTESQLYTLVITGHLQLGGGTAGSSTPTQQAASFLGGVLASKLQKTLAKRLPLDVLTIDAGSGGLAGTQLEAGRYVTDKLYVGYVGRIGADPTRYQNRNAVHVEYQLTSRWGFDGEYGDVGTGSLDLLWKKNY